MVPPLNLARDPGRVVTGFDCTGLDNCTNTTMYGDCPNDYATVTCQRGIRTYSVTFILSFP